MPSASSSQPVAPSTPLPLEKRRRTRWPFWVALLVAVAAFGVMVADARVTLLEVWDALLRDPGQVGLGATLAVTLIVTLPLLAGAAAGFLAWQGARLLQLVYYLDGIHRDAANRLEHTAPLSRLGYVARGMPFAASGLPGTEEVRLSTVIERARGVLLLGDDGIGKTTALTEYAHTLSARRNLLAIAFGRRPLPILMPLPYFARAASAKPDELAALVADQLRAFGASHLAARAPSALPHWNVALLCDGLDEIPSAQRQAAAEQFSAFLGADYPEAHVVATCSLSAYLADAPLLASLNALERVVLTGVRADDAPRLLRHGVRSPRARALVASYTDPETARGLGSQLTHPATLAALIEVLAANPGVPPGRGHLLRAYADVLCARAGEDALAARLRTLLETLAGALRANEVAAIPLLAGASPVATVRDWLERTSGWSAPAADELAPVVEAALRAGILEQPRGAACIRFVARSVEAVFAALALERFDRAAPDQALPPDLLAPQWQEPALLWAGFADEPGALAERILSLPSPATTGAEAAVAVPALALAAALEAFAPALAEPRSPLSANAEPSRTVIMAEPRLRMVFDEIGRRMHGTEARQALVHALAVLERQGLVDLTSHLVAVARHGTLGRLVRAPAIELLGAIATPTSLDALVALLTESDAVLRGAVDRALAVAGPLAVPRLQRALGGEDERLRLRALEALGQSSAHALAAVVAATTSEDAHERETAARALGALKATEGVPALAALLDDRAESVRLAAADALGRIRVSGATTALIARAGAPQATMRVAIAAALGETRDAAALTALLGLLGDAAPPVRAAAAAALGKLGDERALRPLRDHLNDADPWAQASAATALRRLGQR